MSRLAALDAVLRHLMRADPETAVAHCRAEREISSPSEPYLHALEAFALFMAARFDEAAGAADAALDEADAGDPVLLATARAARAIAQAGRPFPAGLAGGWAGTAPASGVSGDPLADAALPRPRPSCAATRRSAPRCAPSPTPSRPTRSTCATT